MQFRKGRRKKKLKDAARHWAARPARSHSPDERAADPKEWQQALEEHEAQFEEEEDALFAVWPENEEVLRVFIALRRCWRYEPISGQTLGLERQAIESTLKLMRIKRKKHPMMLEKLMLMEEAALPILNRK